MMEILTYWHHATAWLEIHAVIPLFGWLHVTDPSIRSGDVAEAMLTTLIQISIIAFIFRPLESIAPAEKWTDRKLTHVDRLYTLIMLLGLFPIFSYVVLMPFSQLLSGGAGEGSSSASDLKHLVPWFQTHPMVLLLVYYIIYDFTYYWMHRAQHLIPWWWAMHSMHHSQRQMSCWTNDRGCYLDGMFQSFILASVGIIMGVNIDEFALLTLTSELVQNFSHTNVRFGFGKVLDKLFVDPKFHRLHHMVVDPQRPNLHNCNFGQVFSIWDVIFGTGLYGEPTRSTGVNDPAVDADNERGLIAMQWYTLKRFWGAFRRPSGWIPGDVGFVGPSFEPVPSAMMSPAEPQPANN